jgi:hypothetical protein
VLGWPFGARRSLRWVRLARGETPGLPFSASQAGAQGRGVFPALPAKLRTVLVDFRGGLGGIWR